MINPRYSDPSHAAVVLDANDGTGRIIYVDRNPLLASVLAGDYGPVAPYKPHVPEEQPLADLVSAKLEAINEGKNVALDAGFVHEGVLFDSDIKARLAYLEVEKKLREAPGYSTDWKASRGQWVTMDATLFASLQTTYEAYISACFAWQGAREQEVAEALALAETDEAAGRAALAAVSELLEF